MEMSSLARRIIWGVAWVATAVVAYQAGLRWESQAPPTIADEATRTENTVAEIELAPAQREEAADMDTVDAYYNLEREVGKILSLTPDAFPTTLPSYLGRENANSELTMLAAQWARNDPKGALEAGLAIEDRSQRYIFLMGLFSTWSSLAPLDAFAAYQEHLADQRHFAVTQSVFQGLTLVNPELALAELTADTEDYQTLKNNRINGIASGLAEHYDLVVSMEVLNQPEDYSTMSIIRSQVVEVWARYDFERTANYAVQYNDSQPGPNQMPLEPIIRVGLEQDHERLLDWAGKQNPSTTLTVVRKWMQNEPEAAEQWVRQMPDPERRDFLFEYLKIAPTNE